MDKLFKKLKKVNKIFLIIYIMTFILYTVNYSLLFRNIINLEGVENLIRFIILGLFFTWLIIYFLWNLVNLILKRHVTIAVTTAVTMILIVLFIFVNYYVGILYKGMSNLRENEYVTYTSNLVAFKNSNIDKNSKLGMINSTDDIEGNVLAKELIDKEKLDENDIISYSSYYEMIYALFNKEVEGIFLNSNYLSIFSEEEFNELKNTEIIYSFSKKLKNQDNNITSNKSLTEPITILLMGVDSEGNGLENSSSFNGDTLMLITFNPKTLNATMFSIPRDTYVPIACNNNRYSKINSSAAYGTNCVIDTIENLTGIDIDYYVKINFKGVVDLVEALDGIDVDVEVPDYQYYYNTYNGRVCEQDSLRQFGDNLICMDTGYQHLNGEQTLAYARCRHAYLQSDIARNKHQQQIIEAIARKLANPSNLYKLDELLGAITNNLATNMTQKQMLSFYDVLKNMISKSFKDGDLVSIQKTYLEYYNLPVRLSNNGTIVAAIGYYPDSLKAIVDLMKVNLELEEKESIKSFSFDANKDYQTKVVGQGITTGEKLETVPNFIGLSVSEAETWALNHNIELHIEFVTSESEFYNEGVMPGLIANQSVNNAVLINNVTDLTIYINKNSSNNNTDNNNDDDNDNQNIIDDPLDMFLPSLSDNNNEEE
ncbi:MAG: LCP family protein [Ruminococcus sp.]|nr:LCP family protein [Ruminococcus sp.]